MGAKHQMARKYPQKDLKLLFGNAANRCAFPNCRAKLALEDSSTAPKQQLGEIAHIVAHEPDGPRGDKNFPKNKLDCYDNWILLCPKCHTIIDKQPQKYSTEVLHKIKNDHEHWVANKLSEEMAYISFTELDLIAKGLVSGVNAQGSSSFKVITPEEKMTKNSLTSSTRQLLIMGLSRSPEVKNYLTQMTLLDPNFSSRLVGGFKEEYLRLRNEHIGDELFNEMVLFSHNGSTEFPYQAAGLAVVCHLFQLCEIFEK